MDPHGRFRGEWVNKSIKVSYKAYIHCITCTKVKNGRKVVLKAMLRLTGIQNISQKLTSTLLR